MRIATIAVRIGIGAACYRTEKPKSPKCRGECWEECWEKAVKAVIGI